MMLQVCGGHRVGGAGNPSFRVPGPHGEAGGGAAAAERVAAGGGGAQIIPLPPRRHCGAGQLRRRLHTDEQGDLHLRRGLC